VDDAGRVVLLDDELQELESAFVPYAGGTTTNGICGGSTNANCFNNTTCTGSTNQVCINDKCFTGGWGGNKQQ